MAAIGRRRITQWSSEAPAEAWAGRGCVTYQARPHAGEMACQSCGALKRSANRRVAISVYAVTDTVSWLTRGRLCLIAEWTDESEGCHRAGVPDDVGGRGRCGPDHRGDLTAEHQRCDNLPVHGGDSTVATDKQAWPAPRQQLHSLRPLPGQHLTGLSPQARTFEKPADRPDPLQATAQRSHQ